MEYTVLELSRLAGVSTHTLRYYDQIGLLKPARLNASGYRLYRKQQLERLQQILFYRAMNISLRDIQAIMADPAFDTTQALRDHHHKLVEERKKLDILIITIEKSLSALRGEGKVADSELFLGLKQNVLRSERQDDTPQQNQRRKDMPFQRHRVMTPQQHQQARDLAVYITQLLSEAVGAHAEAGELAQQVARLHHQWLCYYWEAYTPQAHAALARRYLTDEHYRACYDKKQPGTAQFLHDAIMVYTARPTKE